MLRLNRLTDYAILVLGALAHRRGDVMPTARLAELTGLNQPTVAKVAKRLQSAGLLETRRGATGGYRLLGAPDDISLVRIVEAVEGPIAVNGCVDGAQDPCAVSNCCFMSNHWNKVNGALRAALQAVSLADLIDPAELFAPQAHQTSAAQQSSQAPQSRRAHQQHLPSPDHSIGH